ncbi:helix-turn-helix domain-containing protein [Pseudopelagicola sp. nBUS_20]|uniref:helix-turn-helix domain-containing protein n=1 Tax=Pseudopelagicola sp. nBUS_20 TaxID=3395317 RepID=UPI003EB962C0
MEDEQKILNLLPTRLREARRAQGLSLDAVAKLSGVSRSMVSQIERGESSPTIATLWNLTRALQVDFAGLLDERAASKKIEILRDAQVPTFENRGKGCCIRILSPPEDAGKHEVYDIRLTASGFLESQPHTRGAREHLTVIDGLVEVVSGDIVEVVGEGDTARYDADITHGIRAHKGPARVFLVVQNA